MAKEKQKTHNLRAVPSPGETSAAARAIKEIDECPKCFGAGMEVVEGKGARICECRKSKRLALRDNLGGIPRLYEKCTFENYVLSNPSQKKAMTLAFIFASQYPAVDQGLLLMGSVGVGKTHLAVSIVKLLRGRGIDALFTEFGSLLKSIRESYNSETQTSELDVLNPVLNAEVLVLDELGASKPSDWVRETLYHIINTRYSENRFTIFTTNFLDERADSLRETLDERVGVPIRSRLFQMCKTVVLSGDDYRTSFNR